MDGEIHINQRRVAPGEPVYVVAELSANHLGDLERAKRIVRAAAQAGADAVKLQTYTPDTLTIDCDSRWFTVRNGTPWTGRSLYDLYAEAATPWEWYGPLRDLARDLGLDLFSTPFDQSAVEFLERFDPPAHKIASFEIVDHELIRAAAATGKPLVISTGMAGLEEISEALAIAQRGGAAGVALLKCTSAYPALPEEMNLRTIGDLATRFGTAVGLSDHTLGIAAALAAVALGACIVEKHLTLSRADGGPDAAFSLEPAEFAEMVSNVRIAEKVIGRVRYGATEGETAGLSFRRSLFVVRDVAKGETLSRNNVRSIRPGCGMPPKHLPGIMGRKAAIDIARGTPLEWSMVS